MSGLRVVMITRRFWPVASPRENIITNLGQQLMGLGLVPSFLTARLAAQWPTSIVFREMAVHRLPFSPRLGWGTIRYLMALSRWLRRHRPNIDLVCVSGLSLEAHVALSVFSGSGIPVVLRAESEEAEIGTTARQLRRLAKQMTGCGERAAAVVAPSYIVRTRLFDAGFSSRQLHVIPDGVPISASPVRSSKLNVRAALAGANEDLRIGLNMPVATYIGPFEPHYGLDELVRAWRRVARDHPYAHLWLIGDGSQRKPLYRIIQDADLVGRVLMPGTFDDLQDVMRASNLLVVPSAKFDQSPTILTAMGEGLPVLVANSPEHERLVRDGVTGRVLAETIQETLADAIIGFFANPEESGRMATSAWQFVQQHHSLREMAKQHQQLFDTLIRSSQRLVT